MELRESVDSMLTRFLHLINKLRNLGKTYSNKDYPNKILRTMCREFQPKVIAMKESKNPCTLDITKLFRKLVEHENELKRLTDCKVKPKKKEKRKEEKMDLSFKASSSKGKKSKEKSNTFDEKHLSKRRWVYLLDTTIDT